MVGCLSESSQGDTTVESSETLFSNDGIDGVSSVSVSWCLQWISERVLLCLQPNLHDFHGRYDSDRLRDTSTETG